MFMKLNFLQTDWRGNAVPKGRLVPLKPPLSTTLTACVCSKIFEQIWPVFSFLNYTPCLVQSCVRGKLHLGLKQFANIAHQTPLGAKFRDFGPDWPLQANPLKKHGTKIKSYTIGRP